jgi:[ribosomal protein S18]-alanine N-acetyltransferase
MYSDAAARREAGLMEINIRPIQGPEEIDVCARMMASSEPWITLQRDYDASAQTLTSPGKEVYVAADGKEILGFVILNLQGGFSGYIQSIGVAPEWRSRGIGRRLVAYAEERIFRDSPNVFICVSSFNPGAQRFYRCLGYEAIGELKDFIVRGHSEILLRKTIAPWREFKKRPV